MSYTIKATHPDMTELQVLDHVLQFKNGWADGSELTDEEIKRLRRFGFQMEQVEDLQADDGDATDDDTDDDEAGGTKTEADADQDDPEQLEAAREEAKAKGIHVTKNMRLKTIQAKIAEAEKSVQ